MYNALDTFLTSKIALNQGGGKGRDGPTNLHCSWFHLKAHFSRNCRKRAAGEPRKEGPTPRSTNSLEQGQAQDQDHTEQERGVGSLERAVRSLDVCGACECPDEGDELYGL